MDSQNKGSVFLQAKQRLQRNRNLFYVGFIIFFIAGYLLFFTSKTWYWIDGKLVNATPFNTSFTIEGREIVLTRWDYSPKQNLMELELNISNNSTDGIEKYTYSAMERRKGHLKIKEMVTDSNFVILKILNVPKNWKEISLHMQISKDTVFKLYTNKNQITVTNSIPDLSKKEYISKSIENNISYYEEKIQQKNKNIRKMKEKIKFAKKHIQQYKIDQVYQTEEERKTTDNKINTMASEINNFNTNIETDLNDIKEYQNRIENLKLKKKNYN